MPKSTPERPVPVPLKNSEETNWSKLLNDYVKANHSESDLTTVQPHLEKMASLKKTLIGISKSPAGISVETINEVLYTYIALVNFAQHHFPLFPGGPVKKMRFMWFDAWTGSQCQTDDSNLEIAAMIFNIGAAYTQLATRQMAEDQAKAAFATYQTAAGIFEALGEMHSTFPPSVTPDLSVNSLNFHLKYCLACAHHAAYIFTAELHPSKHILLAKLAADARALYAALVEKSKELLVDVSATMKATLQMWEVFFEIRAHMHHCDDAQGRSATGEALGRAEKAKHLVPSAEKHLSTYAVLVGSQPAANSLQDFLRAVIRRYDALHEENYTAIFDKVVKEFPALEGNAKPMGKPTVAPKFSTNAQIKDPFTCIIPVHIISVESKFKEEVTEMVKEVASTVSTRSAAIRKEMQQLGIAGVLRALSGDQVKGIPPDMRKKIEKLRKGVAGGGKVVDSLLNRISVCKGVAESSLNNVITATDALDQEKSLDTKYRKIYGTLWEKVRLRSDELPDVKEATRLAASLRTRVESMVLQPLTLLKAELNDNLQNLSRLDWSMEDLNSLLPYSGSAEAKQMTSELTKLVEEATSMVEKLEDAFNVQQVTVSEMYIRLNKSEIGAKLCSVASSKHDDVLEAERNHYSKNVEELTESLDRVESYRKNLSRVLMKIAERRSVDKTVAEMEQVVNSLEGGINFYNAVTRSADDLCMVATTLLEQSERLVVLAKSCCAARAAEAEQLQQEFDQQLNDLKYAQELANRPPSDVIVPSGGNSVGGSFASQAPNSRQVSSASLGASDAAPTSKVEELQRQIAELEAKRETDRQRKQQEMLLRQQQLMAAQQQQQQQQQGVTEAPPAYEYAVAGSQPKPAGGHQDPFQNLFGPQGGQSGPYGGNPYGGAQQQQSSNYTYQRP